VGLHGVRFSLDQLGCLALQARQRAVPEEALAGFGDQLSGFAKAAADFFDIEIAMIHRMVEGHQPADEAFGGQDVAREFIVFMDIWDVVRIKKADAWACLECRPGRLCIRAMSAGLEQTESWLGCAGDVLRGFSRARWT